MDSLKSLSPRGKRVQRQPMTNGGLNVEIGNPSYNMYEVDHDNHADAGSLLKPNFTLDPHKVCPFTCDGSLLFNFSCITSLVESLIFNINSTAFSMQN